MYDLIIIGGGPAGLSAAIYAGRYKLKALLLTKIIGGMMSEAHLIENYPGVESVTGMDLAEKMKKQVEHLGVKIEEEEVVRLEKTPNGFLANKKHEAKYILLALGTERKKLNLAKEKEFAGKGVSYCATCDAPLFKDKEVAVVGGKDSAVMAAELLASYARKVYVIYRGEQLQAQPVARERLLANPKVEAIYKANVSDLQGKSMLESIKLDNGREIKVDGLFVEIGSTPSVILAKELGIKLDHDDCITVDQHLCTSMPHVYAAGDITSHNAKWRQVVIACAEGALAARSIYEDFKRKATSEHV
ncbi:MAG: FAD-dependent oxidoreductase [Candidatus Woesearchaeota archaeon]